MLTWRDVLAVEKKMLYFQQILSFIAQERRKGVIIYPPDKDIFNAFRFTELNKVKVVIIGQDPYSRFNQAHGLSFSVNPGVLLPPSLKNIYKELSCDIIGFIAPKHGCLYSWSQQGVMLLNAILTVEAGKSRSHVHLGWEIFTDKVIKIISSYLEKIVFLLWGRDAQKKGVLIDHNRHYILISSHPSPLSAHRGFLGCRHFSLTNAFLLKQEKKPINWTPNINFGIKVR